MKPKEKDAFDELAEKWPSGLVARTEIGRCSGGLLSSKYLANLDSQGLGPPRVKVGRRVAYPVGALIDWMRNRGC